MEQLRDLGNPLHAGTNIIKPTHIDDQSILLREDAFFIQIRPAEAIKRQSGPSLYRTEKRRSIWQAYSRGKL